MINYLILISLISILAILIYLLSSIKNKETFDRGGNENLQNKLNEVSVDINKVEIDLAELKTPINELNRFLGGNVTTGRLGEWSLESIVQDMMPDKSYSFQDQVNPKSADRVDCSIVTAEDFIVPIDSKFYAGQYQSYQSAGNDTDRQRVLRDLRTAILRDAEDISKKYIVKDKTTNYVVLYIASEKLIDLVVKIDDLRQECLTEKKVLIMGPNTLAAFLDTIIVGHNHVKLNENAAKISKIIREIQLEFSNFDSSTESVIKRLDGALKDVQKLQTRVNVLGSRLEKGAENLKEEE
ncbi:MAG: DNA recombination protein RmuC [Gammaproteobacteria bacterium]